MQVAKQTLISPELKVIIYIFNCRRVMRNCYLWIISFSIADVVAVAFPARLSDISFSAITCAQRDERDLSLLRHL